MILEYKVLLLIFMIFLHILNDFNLQGWLVSAKQKSWWEENAPDEMYKNDYLMALFIHSFSWTFMIMAIPFMYAIACGKSMLIIFIIFGIHLLAHFRIDDMKANKKSINLIIDQCLHLMQIVSIWICVIL